MRRSQPFLRFQSKSTNEKTVKKLSLKSLIATLPATVLTAGYIVLTQIYDTSLCVIRSMTGYPCPGCGLTSAGLALLQGNFTAAWNFNAVIYLLPFAVAVFLTDKRFIRPKFPKFSLYFFLSCMAIMIIYFIVRICLYFPDGIHPMNISKDTIPQKIISRPMTDGSKGK